jgi:hypothetical protein
MGRVVNAHLFWFFFHQIEGFLILGEGCENYSWLILSRKQAGCSERTWQMRCWARPLRDTCFWEDWHYAMLYSAMTHCWLMQLNGTLTTGWERGKEWVGRARTNVTESSQHGNYVDQGVQRGELQTLEVIGLGMEREEIMGWRGLKEPNCTLMPTDTLFGKAGGPPTVAQMQTPVFLPWHMASQHWGIGKDWSFHIYTPQLWGLNACLKIRPEYSI